MPQSDPIIFLDQPIGPGQPTFVIAEVGLNHNGDLSIAKQLIEEAADAGCNAVKFQKRDVNNLAVNSFLDLPDSRFPEFGQTYREIRQFVEFDRAQYQEIIGHANLHGIPFFCTPFDLPSAHFLQTLGVQAFKIASHCVTFSPLLDHVASLGHPTIMSTGMASLDELDRAVNIFQTRQCPLILLHCVSSYPTDRGLVNLRTINYLRSRYNLPVGYSGHEESSLEHAPTLGAVYAGACVVERHVTLDTKMMGFDHALSICPHDLRNLLDNIRLADQLLGIGEKIFYPEEQQKREQQVFSIVSATKILKGNKITKCMLTYKGPGTGLPAYRADDLINKIAIVDIPPDTLIELKMVRQAND